MTTVELYLRRHLFFVSPADSKEAANSNARIRLAANDDRPRLYDVKCDRCKTTIRQTASLQESAAGGHCAHCTAEASVFRFEVGKSYMMRSPGDYSCVWTYRVLSRTARSVTLISSGGRRIRRCIKVHSGSEHCMPLGTYSLAPCLSAEREVKP